MPDKIEYEGRRNAGNAIASKIINGKQHKLDPRYDLRNHSPDGFEWGYPGSGPAQLALAILADALEDDGRALELYQNFKIAAIATLPRDAIWTMSREAVIKSADAIEKAMKL